MVYSPGGAERSDQFAIDMSGKADAKKVNNRSVTL